MRSVEDLVDIGCRTGVLAGNPDPKYISTSYVQLTVFVITPLFLPSAARRLPRPRACLNLFQRKVFVLALYESPNLVTLNSFDL